MIELVVFFYQVISIVGDEGGAVFLSCFANDGSVVGYHLDQVFFLLGYGSRCRQLFGQNDALFGSFTQNGTDTGICVLDERAGITVEIDRFLRVESHVLARVHLQDEVFQGTEADHAGDVFGFFRCHFVHFAQFLRDFAGCTHHLFHQVVCIDNRSFAALHLAFRQFNHAVREMYKAFAEFKTQFIQQDGQYLEMVVLLVSYHIDHFVDRIVIETQFGSSDILCHVDGSSVGTEQQFLVQAVFGQVCPYGTVFTAVENAFVEPFQHFAFTFQVGL